MEHRRTWHVAMAEHLAANDCVPHGHWKTTTFVAGLRRTGMVAPWVLDGPMGRGALTTYVTEVRTAVKATSPIKSVADLNGKTVATTTGTTSVALLRKNKRAQNIKFNEVYGKDHADSFLLLESGRADAFVMDDNILAGLIAGSSNPKGFKIVGETLNVEPIAIMIRKDDPKFKAAVDDYIRKAMRDGEIKLLYTKWFLQPIPPKNTSVNLPMGTVLADLVKNPSDKPAEDFNK